jgi:hypothetical protein
LHRLTELQKTLDECSKDIAPNSLAELKDKAEQISEKFFQKYQNRYQTEGQPYPDEIKKFTLSLHLKSAKAYRYVRSVFKVNNFWKMFYTV